MNFNREAKFNITIRRLGDSWKLRYPTDEELIKRQRKLRIEVSPEGDIETPNLTQIHYELFKKLLLDQDPEECDLDLDSASLILDKLTAVRAIDSTWTDDAKQMEVVLDCAGGIETEHVLRVPSEREYRKFQKDAFSTSPMRRGWKRMFTNLPVVGAFFDQLVVSSSGYDGQVPLNHKLAVIMEVQDLISRMEEEDEVEVEGNFS